MPASLAARLRELVRTPRFVLFTWMALAVLASAKKLLGGGGNNFSIYTGSFWHALQGAGLYGVYPAEYFDRFLYGPIFSLLIAPFALVPTWVGAAGWLMLNAVALYAAIRALPIGQGQRVAILWLITNELFTAFVNFQVNPLVAASLVAAYALVRREREGWAALVVVLGAAVKVYSVVGLVFILFARRPWRFALSCAAWGLVVAAVPLLAFGAGFGVRSYVEWFQVLVLKDGSNAHLGNYQDFSVMGLARRLIGDPTIPSAPFLFAAALAHLALLGRRERWRSLPFQLQVLAITLIAVVIFSSSSEGSTYIIAFVGVALWFVAQPPPRPRLEWWLLAFAMALTSLSPTLLPPTPYRTVVVRYALKALPCVLIWAYAIWRLVRRGGDAPIPDAPAEPA